MRAHPLLATVLALAALTGCSGDADPVAALAPAPSVAPPPVVEPTPVDVLAPVVEEPAPAPTPTGPGMEWVYEQNGRFEENEASLFVAYLVPVMSYGWKYNDSRPLRAISSPTCQTCAEWAESMDAALRNGTIYEGGETYLRSTMVTEVFPETQKMTVELITRTVAGRALSRDGEVLAEFPEYEYEEGPVYIVMENGKWQIAEIV
ncbi:DUF6318 family protein [Kineococcus sp. SYSU DK004]|uniref:DUF6318 family protein n=1 Tax=Kineococcus sp. SYSU DK004 TaxID=3383125 RepID=UPI003D7E86F9